MSSLGRFDVGNVTVTAEVNRGHPPEFWAERVTDKIVGKMHANMPDHVRQQGEAFREEIKGMIYRHMLSAIRSDRQTVAGELRKSGYPAIARDVLNFKG